jgi:hypothetical protein
MTNRCRVKASNARLGDPDPTTSQHGPATVVYMDCRHVHMPHHMTVRLVR